MGIIFSKEIRAFFNSSIAFATISFFMIFIGICVWVYPNYNILDSGYAELTFFFKISPYIFCFLIPSISMGMISEENKNGTMEILLTSPLSIKSLILGKYLAILSIITSILIISLVYVVTIYYISFPEGNIDLAGICGSYIGLFLLSCSFAAIGIFSSACTNAQITSFVLGSAMCIFFYYSFELCSILQSFNRFSFYIQQLGIKFHYDAISKGLINMKDVIYFLLMSGCFLFLTEDRIKKMQTK